MESGLIKFVALVIISVTCGWLSLTTGPQNKIKQQVW